MKLRAVEIKRVKITVDNERIIQRMNLKELDTVTSCYDGQHRDRDRGL